MVKRLVGFRNSGNDRGKKACTSVEKESFHSFAGCLHYLILIPVDLLRTIVIAIHALHTRMPCT